MQDRHGNTDSTLRGLLSRLFGGGGWGMGAGQAPTINQAGVSAVPYGQQQSMPAIQQAPTDSQALAIAQSNENGPMTDANLPPGIRQRRGPPPTAFAAPAGTLGGMPITEGQNANIGDDSRQRALEMVAALRNGGAL